ncbi:MAG: hypothetical protein Q4G42_06165 [Neisseria sp.]|nr:hypothetical protein [Neisseria sp.]
MKRIILIALLTVSSSAYAADCTQLAQSADATAEHIIPRVTFQVSGKDRLYFYSAPADECRTQAFIIPKDHVIAYQTSGAWTYVMYLHPKTHQDTGGWIRTDRLEFIGTASAMP